ncbi:kinesin-like protein KIN-7C, mitochondrial isoform X1 [Daucus carota subsp. sativus]|uniref:kinesin-like protein KIN-7C, mitochondrial isoform X1 n=1 Tax=Daucus carota subsp. sativus TaxID=79200 RepID=UPI0007EF6909|nr:PREDICTED: kinesin-like protein KIN-7C, mitochondrial isoform X1 [Daucus carota subsp. sativus]
MSSSSRLRSSISPFRSRKSPAPVPPPATKSSATRPSPSSSSSRSSSRPPPSPSTPPVFDRPDSNKSKESVTVTVRFRPLSSREIGKGDEIAWFADGDYTVRNEYNSSIAYGFDRVFGPATTTRHVYDIAAQHVVSGSMEGINGTVFAYGVTSSGKTHTMHGEQKSPGIIPLAVKDVFSIIQETPGREYLLRVSYLEIYNEVINDLLDPIGQNLKIREDSQGTYVEGIKEEVVLSPAHALSLIASGEAHRHVGSNNFNLLSSRSHTIFTLTIESSPCGEDQGEEVTLSQLHLIDLAGSESSKTETTGLRRKEGSYINKSLLTLGTVISKLTDGKATHIPYRDSKLTRLLQSSLSGHGRVSLICTVTPASTNTEETHNTLKFAHRSKHVELKASQNKIMDEKSLIKKYQKEISILKQELQQLKLGMMENPLVVAPNQEDLVNLKLQLEAGQVKLQSRLEEEEEAKAALMGRIQRLTKLILVSTKSTLPSSVPGKLGHRRRHSFGEDELAYLPDRKRELMLDDDAGSINSETSAYGRSEVTDLDELMKDYRKSTRKGMLGWFKLKKPDNMVRSSPSTDCESSASGSPASSARSSQNRVTFSDTREGQRKSISRRREDSSVTDSFPARTLAGDLFSATAGTRHLPPTGTTITDQMDLLREQVKMLAGEVALCTSSLKRLSEEAARNPDDLQNQEDMRRLKDEIREKKLQIRTLEQRMIGSVEIAPCTSNINEMSQALSKLASQLNEKTFDLEIKAADNRILQEQLQLKVSENAEMQETILLLRRQLDSALSTKNSKDSLQNIDNNIKTSTTGYELSLDLQSGTKNGVHAYDEMYVDQSTPTSVMSLNRAFSRDSRESRSDALMNSHHEQAAEIEALKQEQIKMLEEKDGLVIHSQKLAEEGTYAKELAAAAAVELRNLAEEVTKLSYQNAKLTADLTAAKEFNSKSNSDQGASIYDVKRNGSIGRRPDERLKKHEEGILVEELGQELNAMYQREASLVSALSERDEKEAEMRRRLDEAKQHEEHLENELANMWVLVANLRKSGNHSGEILSEGVYASKKLQTRDGNVYISNGHPMKLLNGSGTDVDMEEIRTSEELQEKYIRERRRCKELEGLISRLKGEDVLGLDMATLEELQNLHVEAITKICHAKCSNNFV